METLPAINREDAKLFSKVSSSVEVLPRIQLMTSGSDACKRMENPFPANNYALVKSKEYINLGRQVDVIVIMWRFKALDFSEKNMVVSYDVKDPVFIDIQERSQTPKSDCLYGIEFLMWIPERREFATFYACNETSRREAPKLRTDDETTGKITPKCVTLSAKEISNTQHTWVGINILDCQSSLEPPDDEILEEVYTRFVNPKTSNVEPAEETKQQER